MLTVSGGRGVVESQLQAGELGCPACAAGLGPWGWARPRVVRAGDRMVWLWPRRARCRGCGVTQVLLPVTVLLRRADVAAVIGWALERAALGWGQRAIAVAVGVARSTVRDWLGRMTASAEVVAAHFVRWLGWLAPAHSALAPAPTALADAVMAMCAAGDAACVELGIAGRWQFVSAATGGRLLCNTSSPFPAPWRG